ncbi:MAG: hypothetical protein PHN45_02165 [Methylococcales bacterium]|nr:hypothetical protein [Methylococcales bacterium]
MKPFDLLAFRGHDFVSAGISILEKRGHIHAKGGEFTHVGIVVDNTILDEPLLEDGKLYVLESTVSGKLGQNVRNIHSSAMLGVQIRDLEEVIDAYDKPNNTHIAWCPLLRNPTTYMECEDVKSRFTEIYHTVDHHMWDANCWDLCSALYPCCRPCRPYVEHAFHTEEWLFCSELVALVYVEMGVLPSDVNPQDVLPADLVYPHEDTDDMPNIIRGVNHVTTPIHYSHDIKDHR